MFHGGEGYDFQLMLKKMNPKGVHKIEALARNGQRFRTLTLNGYQILDSCAHLPSSLDHLSAILRSDETHTYPLLRQSSIIKKIQSEEEKLSALSKLTKKGQVIFDIFCFYFPNST